jgi:hypothetical protein
MTIQPALLIQDAIEKLEQLSALLAQDVGTGVPAERLPPERRMRKEVLLTIRVLLPKLHAAQSLPPQCVPHPRPCRTCDD